MTRLRIFLLVFTTCVGTLKATERPNIVFLAIDDLRPEIAAYGSKQAITPNIDVLASQSVRFGRSYVTYPLCLPSRASMLTGRRINYEGQGKKRSFAELIQLQQTWPRVFRDAGYWTATTGKLYHGSVPQVDGDAWDRPGVFWHDDVKDWSPELMKRVVDEGGDPKALASFRRRGKGSGALIWQSIDGDDDVLNDGKTASKAIEYIRNRPKSKPFVICAGFSRPHMPWLAPKKYFDLYPDDVGKLAFIPEGAERVILKDDRGAGVGNNALWNEGMTDAQSQKLIRGYLASVSYADAQVGRILKELSNQGLDENTVVVLWGDHGYHLTDHGLWRKNTHYHIASRNPFLIRVPKRSSGVCDRIVEAIDIYPTLIELAGLDADQLRLDGRSLAPLLDDPKTEWPHPAFIHAGKFKGMVTDKYRFSFSRWGDEKLFDLTTDPHEWNNLADDPRHGEMITSMKEQVSQAWAGDSVSDATISRPKPARAKQSTATRKQRVEK